MRRMEKMKQYEMFEMTFTGEEPLESWSEIDLWADFVHEGEKIQVRGFYAGNGIYKIRFLPQYAGIYEYELSGEILSKLELPGGLSKKNVLNFEKADEGHGMVQAEGLHFVYQDGTFYYPFGTTVYGFVHQTREIQELTFETLEKAPFNKIRICVFPKNMAYNRYDPEFLPFEKKKNGWNTDRPCMSYWEHLENVIGRLGKMGIQTDLILFHPYDHDKWGFDKMDMEDNRKYLTYLVSRLAAFSSIWWSLANEYDAFEKRRLEEWEMLEQMMTEFDPYGHLLSCHNILTLWNASRPAISHVSVQTSQLTRVNEWQQKYNVPVIVDECCYEGNTPENWGSISAKELTRRFWCACTVGGYCTHGETFLDENDIMWWSRGGILKGESSERIAFLREIIESLPGPLECKLLREMKIYNMFVNGIVTMDNLAEHVPSNLIPFYTKLLSMEINELKAYLAVDMDYCGHYEEEAYLYYYDKRTCSREWIELPEKYKYRIEVIDIWEMTRETIAENVNGKVEVYLPGKEGTAVLALAVEKLKNN